MAAWKSLAMLVVGMIGLSFGAEWFVAGASTMAREAGVSEQTIGLTIVAVGTSLPELVTSLVAAFRKQPDISLGNLVGSNIFNLLGIIGFTAAVLPIRVDYGAFRPDLAWMAGIALLLLPMMLPKRMVRWQGLLLFAAYAAYIGTVLVRA
jgi:cation:H+ antiporter